MVSNNCGLVRVVSRIYMPEASAASLRLEGCVNALREAGVGVQVMTSIPPKGTRFSADKDVSRFPVLRNHEGYVRGYLQYLSFDIPAFFRLLFTNKSDVILVEPPPTTGAVVRVAARIRGIPYVYYAADVWSEAVRNLYPGVVYRALRVVEKFAVQGAEKVIAVNSEVANQVNDMGAQSAVIVPQGVDTRKFKMQGPTPTAQMRTAMGVGDSPYFIYPGNASEWHGAGIFIEALKLLSSSEDCHLVFLGRGGQWQLLRNSARAKGLEGKVHFSTTVPPEVAAQWIRGSICSLAAIKPRSGYEFAYTTKALSSFSCGVPVLYAGPGEAGEDIRKNQLGWAVSYSPSSVAAGMNQAIEDTRKDSDMGIRLREWVCKNRSLKVASGKVAELLMKSARSKGMEK